MANTGLGLLLLILLSCILTITAEPVIYNCTEPSKNSRYLANLDLFLSSLSSDANTATGGFYNSSTGDGSEEVYGLFLCRGDTTTEECQNCVEAGVTDIQSLCSNMTTSIFWYDECMIRYTNQSIFSILEQDPVYYLYNINDVSNLDQYNQTVGDLMSGLVKQAAYGSTTPKYYAAAEVDYYTGTDKVYGLVQCTPDITQDECNGCLNGSVTLDIPHILYPKMGGRVLKPSCNLRYEFNSPFYNQAPSPSATPPSTATAPSPSATAPSTATAPSPSATAPSPTATAPSPSATAPSTATAPSPSATAPSPTATAPSPSATPPSTATAPSPSATPPSTATAPSRISTGTEPPSTNNSTGTAGKQSNSNLIGLIVVNVVTIITITILY